MQFEKLNASKFYIQSNKKINFSIKICFHHVYILKNTRKTIKFTHSKKGFFFIAQYTIINTI